MKEKRELGEKTLMEGDGKKDEFCGGMGWK